MSYEKKLIIKCNVPIYTLWTDLMFYKEKKNENLNQNICLMTVLNLCKKGSFVIFWAKESRPAMCRIAVLISVGAVQNFENFIFTNKVSPNMCRSVRVTVYVTKCVLVQCK